MAGKERARGAQKGLGGRRRKWFLWGLGGVLLVRLAEEEKLHEGGNKKNRFGNQYKTEKSKVHAARVPLGEDREPIGLKEVEQRPSCNFHSWFCRFKGDRYFQKMGNHAKRVTPAGEKSGKDDLHQRNGGLCFESARKKPCFAVKGRIAAKESRKEEWDGPQWALLRRILGKPWGEETMAMVVAAESACDDSTLR